MTATDRLDPWANTAARTETHFGRSWSGPGDMEANCPCPKAPCGLVVWRAWDVDCDQHNPHHPSGPRTIRQSHKADECTAAMPPLDLDAIQRRADAAAPGPWATGGHGRWRNLHRHEVVIAGNRPLLEIDSTDQGAADAAFIAAARTDVPFLAAEVKRLRRIVANVESLTVNTDGDEIGPDVEIPVGEVRRMLHDPNPQHA